VPDTNSVDGTVVGAVVQAGTISGGVHLHLPRPEAPRQLTAPPRLFVGRDAELAELHAAAEAPLVVLTGPGGVGKTTLARRWAYDVTPRFPDGQLYIDLQGFSEATAVDPDEALGYLLRALGVPAERVPAAVAEQSARYRSLTAGRALLIVLDNAFSVAQVRQLLAAGTTRSSAMPATTPSTAAQARTCSTAGRAGTWRRTSTATSR
jgi:predicted ATPase